jgi:gluconate:H+ symporter, GntP family
MLITVVPISEMFNHLQPQYVIITLFLCSAVFKSLQGSSMATFAAIAPVTAPIIAASNISPVIAVYSIALGSFVAVLPNDSFYWLTREDAYKNLSDIKATLILGGGSIVQALTGLLFLFIINGFQLII